MRIQFQATNAEFDDDEYSMICGVDGLDAEGIEHALSFDRLSETASAEDPDDDWGVHTQFDDQSNGAYGRVRRCLLSRKSLNVDLSGQLGGLVGVDGFDVELSIDDNSYQSLQAGLARIFRGMPDVLILAEPDNSTA